MAKAITTIKRVLNYPTDHAVWFAVNQAILNQIAAFYLEVILEEKQIQENFLDFSNKEALRAREMLTHTKEKNPTPVIPLSLHDWRRYSGHISLCRDLRYSSPTTAFHLSRSHATSSQETDYAGVS